MPDDQDSSAQDGTTDPTQQPVVISASDFPVLFATLHYTSADDMLQAIGIDPSTINDDNDLPVA
jgi:hypothetical protein